jgi:hypothetical protein
LQALATATLPTLAEQVMARQILDERPALMLLCDVAVLAHLTALPLPLPGPAVRAVLTALDSVLLDHAIVCGVGERVSARTAVIARTHSPASLAAHVVADLRRIIVTGRGCPADLAGYALAGYRWNPARVALARLLATDSRSGAHPDTASWSARFGIEVPTSLPAPDASRSTATRFPG